MIIITSVLICVSAFGAPEDDPVRVYADSMAQAIVANRDAVLLELLGPLGGIRNDFGNHLRI
jgi:hypothetical protein